MHMGYLSLLGKGKINDTEGCADDLFQHHFQGITSSVLLLQDFCNGGIPSRIIFGTE